MSGLKPQEEEVLLLASPEGIHACGTKLGHYLENNYWLHVDNLYYSDPIGQIGRDRQDGSIVQPDHLIEYIAVSAPLHLFDGWAYLGKALLAQVRGLSQIAIHLGYYAELRAAMSLLAAQGVGVFKHHHFAVDDSGTLHRLPATGKRPTHLAVWEYLEYWAQLPHARSLFGRVIRPRSMALSDWLNQLPCTGDERWSPVASRLIQDFGLDLKRMANDRAVRNDASYRPSELISSQQLKVHEAVDFLVETVRSLEPGGVGGSFTLLDLYLLHSAVTRVFTYVTDAVPTKEPDRFSGEVEAMLNALFEDKSDRHVMKEFLSGRTLVNDQRLITQRAVDRVDNSDPRPLLARATLLLRIATGVTRDFMHTADIGREHTEGWWNRKASEIGLSSPADQGSDVGDMWRYVVDALDEIDEWRSSGNDSVRGLLTNCAYPLQETTNLGLVAAIGLGL